MKKIAIALLFVLACGGNKKMNTEETKTEVKKVPYMNIQIKDYGLITIKTYSKEVPNNVSSIVQLTNKGFYNGLKFHRIIEGFMTQGGDPNGDGTGGPGYELEDEIVPGLTHKKGTVAMANRGPNTNGSQFYICLEPQPRLDGSYTIIGEVVSGMDVVEKIGAVKTTGPPSNRPLKDVIMEKVWIEEK